MTTIVEGCTKANMSDWKQKKMEKKAKGSQTPGHKKRADTCQSTSIGGLPRKAYTASRGYKLRNYHEFCEHSDRLFGGKK